MLSRTLNPALDHKVFEAGDGFGGAEAFGTGFCAVHDGVATVESERVFEGVKPLAGRLVAAVDDPAIGLQQRSGAEEAILVPPVRRTRGGAAGAQYTLVQAIQLGAIFRALRPLFLRRHRLSFQPRLDRAVLRVKMRHVRHEVFYNAHVRQRIDAHVGFNFADGLRAGERIAAVDIH